MWQLTETQLAVLDALDRRSQGERPQGLWISARILDPRGLDEEDLGVFKRIWKIDDALADLRRFGLVERRNVGHNGQVVPDDHDGFFAILHRLEPSRVAVVKDLLTEWRARARPTPRSRPSALAEPLP